MPFKPPPPVEDKPSGGFQPPPPVEDKAAPPGALSRFGTGLYQGTIEPFVNAVKHPIQAIGGAIGLPDYQQVASEFSRGNYGQAAMHAIHAADPIGRMAEGAIQPIVEDVKQGNLAGATGRGLGTAAMAALPMAGEGAAAGARSIASGIAESPRTADVVKGIGQVAGSPVVGLAGHPYIATGLAVRGLKGIAESLTRDLTPFERANQQFSPHAATPSQSSVPKPEPFVPPAAPQPSAPQPPPIDWEAAIRSAPRRAGLNFADIPAEPQAPPPAPAPSVSTPTVQEIVRSMGGNMKNPGDVANAQATLDAMKRTAAPIAKPSTAKPLPKTTPQDIARQLADTMAEGQDEANMRRTPEGGVEFGPDYSQHMAEIAADDRNLLNYLNSIPKPKAKK